MNMNTNLVRLLCIGLLLTAVSLSASAQERASGQADPTEGTFRLVAAQSSIGKLVKNQPYSATAITETIQTLSDGNQIIRNNQAKLYRDSQGRTRSEQTLGTIGKWSSDGEAPQVIAVNDPVAGVSFTLDSRKRTAFKSVVGINTKDTGDITENLNERWGITASRLKQAAMDQAMAEKKEMLAKQGKSLPPVSLDELKQLKMKMASADGKRTNEAKKVALGKQVIEGIETDGLSVTITIPAGEIGNKLPIEVTTETWYSPELQMVVLSKHHDPRSGDTNYHLTNITRSEPDRSLFEIPADYSVQESSIIRKKLAPKEDR
jgi:hypothetical protein